MRFTVSTFLFLILFSIFFSCARRGSPTGGPKDSIPPILVKAIPNIETVNFKEEKIKIYFDEYIKLKDLKKKLVISPPQKTDPIITPLGTASKFITIKILDTLEANTTYTFNFGNSIVDNNEENELGNFKYVFSTGTYIDSLTLTGSIYDPTIKESIKNIDVMLYEYNERYTDSIIYKEKPRYLANTLDSTLFDLTNLKGGKYLLIALKDANSNKIYEPKIDKIGFIEDTISLPTTLSYEFPIFKEIPELKVYPPKEASKGHIIFGFEGNADNLELELLTQTPENFNYVVNYEKDKDTLNFWYSPFEVDSLNFSVSKEDYFQNLSVRLRNSKIDSLKVQKSTSSVLHLLDTFSISTNTPIIKVDTSLIKIFDKDSLLVDFNTILSKSKNKLYINFDKKQNSSYNFEILPNTITDIYEISNDSLFFKLTTKSLEDYGNIYLNLVSDKQTSFIVQLLDTKNTLIRRSIIKNPQIVAFKNLLPGNYLIRVILDENNSGKWDTGSFLNRRQPETIMYFNKELELRANWDLNETFIIN
ncbi:Ig-like domain-containing protein [Lutibacter sp. B1]|uniref:Ig-like domain-containing protein n=1 Tax=Lutibacter sp. B1 TaxID=2725996 RepID=UPI001457732A|nr:Ig-like domain-containing protein [Lutibacter sp. B1]NLP57642.1 hypothetical protein [Lutibacter sp. B1]